MFAARDQENLVHGHQTVAATKSMNQGVRQIPPKTPGNKLPKTPFKIPLNDENAAFGFPKGLKPGHKGNENVGFGKKTGTGEKSTLLTPAEPRSRAPLGMKTTNAKAKAFQTPARLPAPGREDSNAKKASVSGRKAKLRIPSVEEARINVLDDSKDLEERDIEYMPPKPKDLPDYPDDFAPLDLPLPGSADYDKDKIHRSLLYAAATMVGDDGMTSAERQIRRREEHDDRQIRRVEAEMLCEYESFAIPCYHSPNCPGGLCKTTIENRKAAQDKYRKTIAAIEAEERPAWKKILENDGGLLWPPKGTTSALTRPKVSGQGAGSSRKAPIPSVKANLSTSLASRPKKIPLPTNPSAMRHSSAVAASKTTVGYSKGRVLSTSVRKAYDGLQKREETATTGELQSNLSPEEYMNRYGTPPLDSDMWFRCYQSGCFAKDDEKSEAVGDSLEDLFRQDALEDFELVLPE